MSQNLSGNLFHKWRHLDPESRSTLIEKFADQIELNRAEFLAIQWAEMSKPPSLASGELNSAVKFGRYVAQLLREPQSYEVMSATPGKVMRVGRSPFGTLLAITSFNTPLPNYMWKVAPALAAGNIVKLKPSPFSVESARLFVELWNLSNPGFESILELIVCSDDKVSEMLESVDAVSFTGSTKVGRIIMQKAATKNLPVIAELGGSNPFVVMASADITEAAKAAVISAFSNGGQRCAAGTRFYIHDQIYNDFISAFVKETKEWLKQPLDVSGFAPLCPAGRVENFSKEIEKIIDSATKIWKFETPDWASSVEGSVAPIIIEFDSLPDPDLELFAPVALVQRIENMDEAIENANASIYGLTAAFWSTSKVECATAAEMLKAGLLNINGPTIGAEPTIPFGGFGASGNGTRETGPDCISQYSASRVVTWT
jgi:aldehyde dehydrogenase (NAD+)